MLQWTLEIQHRPWPWWTESFGLVLSHFLGICHSKLLHPWLENSCFVHQRAHLFFFIAFMTTRSFVMGNVYKVETNHQVERWRHCIHGLCHCIIMVSGWLKGVRWLVKGKSSTWWCFTTEGIIKKVWRTNPWFCGKAMHASLYTPKHLRAFQGFDHLTTWETYCCTVDDFTWGAAFRGLILNPLRSMNFQVQEPVVSSIPHPTQQQQTVGCVP